MAAPRGHADGAALTDVPECVFLPPTQDQLVTVGLLMRGLQRHEIGRRLGISTDAVRARLEEARYRTGSHNTVNLVALCLSRGWLPPVPDPMHRPPDWWLRKNHRAMARAARRAATDLKAAEDANAAAAEAAARSQQVTQRVRKILGFDGR